MSLNDDVHYLLTPERLMLLCTVNWITSFFRILFEVDSSFSFPKGICLTQLLTVYKKESLNNHSN